VFLEIQGEFSEILDVEKNDNALLVQFLSVYIEQKIGEGEDIVEILEGLNRAAKKLLSWHKSQKK
jgi:ferritin